MVNDPSRSMIECENCLNWCHFEGVDVVDVNSINYLKWNCTVCKSVFLK